MLMQNIQMLVQDKLKKKAEEISDKNIINFLSKF